MKENLIDPLQYRLSASDIAKNYSDVLEVLTNVPDSPALIPVPIDRAGIAKQSVYINLPLLLDRTSLRVPVLCEVEASTRLQSSRGVHMSRFEECLFEAAAREDFHSLDSFALLLARNIRERQKSTDSYVKISGVMLIPRQTPISNKISHDRITLISEVHCSSLSERVFVGVEAVNVTACPCTRAYTKFSVVPTLLQKGFKLEQIQEILDTVLTGTHLQRGTVSLKMEKTADIVTADALFHILDTSTHLVFDLLKRPDEHELVISALRKPQFTEDVARDISFTAFRVLGEHVVPTTIIEIRSLLHDSIHIHDVFSEVRTTFRELGANLSSSSPDRS